MKRNFYKHGCPTSKKHVLTLEYLNFVSLVEIKSVRYVFLFKVSHRTFRIHFMLFDLKFKLLTLPGLSVKKQANPI